MVDDDKLLDERRRRAWLVASATQKPMTMTAEHVDYILQSLVLCETAIFKLSESISQLHAGDIATSKSSNLIAIDHTRHALEKTKELIALVQTEAMEGAATDDAI